MKTNNLKPCPLCGTTENVAQYSGKPYKGSRQVYCNKCGLQWFTNTDGSYDTWNTRPIEDGLQAEIERLNAKVAELESYKQLRKEVNAYHIGMGAELTIEVVDRNTDRHFRMMSNWKLIKDDTGWEDTRRLVLDKFANWSEQ